MSKVSLARGFIIRKFFKKIVDKTTGTITTMPIYSEVGVAQGENQTRLDAQLECYKKAQTYLVQINNEIDDANSRQVEGKSARSCLNELEALKQRLAIFNRMADDYKNFVPVKTVFDIHAYNPQTKELGNNVEKSYQLNTTCNVTQEIKDLNRQIRILEDQIAHINTSVFLDSDAAYWEKAIEEIENL